MTAVLQQVAVSSRTAIDDIDFGMEPTRSMRRVRTYAHA
jgi:hypothetical protein